MLARATLAVVAVAACGAHAALEPRPVAHQEAPVTAPAPSPPRLSQHGASRPPEVVELMKILGKHAGTPTVDPARHPSEPLAPGWDPASVWLVEYHQTGHDVTLLAMARSDADLVQFLLRLQIDALFGDVTIGRAERDHTANTLLFEVTVISKNPDLPREAISIIEW
jgi:hypothetical protein